MKGVVGSVCVKFQMSCPVPAHYIRIPRCRPGKCLFSSAYLALVFWRTLKSHSFYEGHGHDKEEGRHAARPVETGRVLASPGQSVALGASIHPGQRGAQRLQFWGTWGVWGQALCSVQKVRLL